VRSIVILFFFFSISFQLNAQNEAVTIIKVDNLHPDGGVLRVAFYAQSIPFLGDEISFSKTEAISENASQSISINVPYGEYAIAIYQDINGDGVLNKNFFGIPKEPYGFSNDAMGMVGPPDFQMAKIVVNQSSKMVNIRLR
jgi:uncharacterized protein (DUF2141 family)